MNDQDDSNDTINPYQINLQVPMMRVDSLNLIVSKGPESEIQSETQFKGIDDCADQEITSEYQSFPYQEMPRNQISIHKKGIKDQLIDKRHEYHIPFEFDLDNPKFWQNFEGTKLVALESKSQDGKTSLKFNLYDYRYSLLSQAEYMLDKEIIIREFQFSHDELYLALQVNSTEYDFCFFENGFENDFQRNQRGMNNFPLTKIKIEEIDEEVNIQFRISSLNHFFLFVDSQIYKSYQTVKNLKNQPFEERLILGADFEPVNPKSLSNQFIKIDGPFVIGFDHEEIQFWAYNYDEEKYCQWNKKSQEVLLQDLGELQNDKVFANPQFNDFEFAWYFFIFGKNKLYIFSLHKNQINPLPEYNVGLQYPEQFQGKIFKIIKIDSIICIDEERIQIYKIDTNLKIIVFLTMLNINGSYYDLMKHSYLFYNMYQGKKLRYYYDDNGR